MAPPPDDPMSPEAMDVLSGAVRALRALVRDDLDRQLRARPETRFKEREPREAATTELTAVVLLRLFLLRQLEASGLALAADLPGLFGEHPLDASVTPSPAALRQVVATLNAPALTPVWRDDTALGWVYQFLNDPQREAIDARVGPRGKVAVDEIASKTQLFTEPYMVEWLLENSVGRVAQAMRRARRGPRSDDPTTPPMFVRGAAPLDPATLPSRLCDLTILDPACGTGHFLAGAFNLLVPLYREEALDRGEEVDDARIAESIVRDNLHGIDIDRRAVQIAAAVLVLKARRLARGCRIPPMNLVATTFEPDLAYRGSLLRFDGASGADVERVVLAHTETDDLGVRFEGAELGAGARLRRLLTDGRYDVVVLNPPYLATSKIDLPADALAEAFGDSVNLVAAFVVRAFELAKPAGLVAFVALSNWMFLSSFRSTRDLLLARHILVLADLGKGAFRKASKLIQSAMVVASGEGRPGAASLGARIGSRDAVASSQIADLAQALRDPASYRPFDPSACAQVEGAPLLFWLDADFLRRFGELPSIGERADGVGGIATTDNERFLRAVWEIPRDLARQAASGSSTGPYLPYLKGGEGREWLEPYRWVLRADRAALELRLLLPHVRVERSERLGVAYTTIGQRFAARLHTLESVRDVSGASVFPRAGADASADDLVCALNRSAVRELASALNPTVNFQLGDVRRLPFDRVEGAREIVSVLRAAFAEAERASELSVDPRAPAPSTWEAAQAWAQAAVDRPRGAPLAPFDPTPTPPSPEAFVSHALGVTLGRFPRGDDARGPAVAPLPLLFLATPGGDHLDSASAPEALLEAWAAHGGALGGAGGVDGLRTYLRESFFELHRRRYENRPIYWPLSSSKRNFVALASIHRWADHTLVALLADHLVPTRLRLERDLEDLGARGAKAAARGDRRLAETSKLLAELTEFIARVIEIADKGPPPPDDATAAREVDAPYTMRLDDGVRVNSAALWPLLEPQWKDPKGWWRELAGAQGKRDSDGSRVAARYFPARVDRRCREDASLAVAHGRLWELHPAKAYAWELRLGSELRPGFTLDEPGSNGARAQFLAERPRDAARLRAKEERRQRRRGASEGDEGEGPQTRLPP